MTIHYTPQTFVNGSLYTPRKHATVSEPAALPEKHEPVSTLTKAGFEAALGKIKKERPAEAKP
jgi:hypothetical protein